MPNSLILSINRGRQVGEHNSFYRNPIHNQERAVIEEERNAMLQRMIQERGSGFSMPPGMGGMNGALSSSANSSQQLLANMMMGNPSPDKKQRRN